MYSQWKGIWDSINLSAAFDYLKDLKKKQEERQRILGSDYQDSDYVCVREDGKLIKPNYIDRVYSHVLKKSSLPYIRFHDLRHSLASNSLNNGLSITQVQAWLGHSTPATTLKYYSHINSSDKLDMAQVLKKLYGSSDKV